MIIDLERDIFNGLNNQQLEAVQSVYGPVLLLAVPGSGKTTVLIKRLGYMIYFKNIKPSDILVVTYTVSATKDMKARFIKYFGEEDSENIEFRTINGICAKMLYDFERESGRKLFDLANDKTINSILINIFMKHKNTFPTENDISNIKLLITYIKNMMFSESEIKENCEKEEECIVDIYNDYINTMKERKLMDYDDQMRYALQIFKAYPHILEKYQNKYKYICVDEAQDTSKIQHCIIKLLASEHRNLFMVGDEDQSIYGFRAAYPEALLDFEKDYSNSKILLMETNYRSNANIVYMADEFIQKNTLRHKKKMYPSKLPASMPEFISVMNREDQFKKLFSALDRVNVETAILYRDNDSAIPIIDYLDRKGIPFNIKKSDFTFFSNPVIKDFKDFLAFSENPCDAEVFMRIYYKINMYLNKDFAVKACRESIKTNKPILKVIKELDKDKTYISERAVQLINYFSMLKTATSRKAITIIMDMIGYGKHLFSRNMSDNKIEILKLLSPQEKTLKDLFIRIDNIKEIIDSSQYNTKAKIILTTIHSSKGLEYESVYMIDVIDNIFPQNLLPKKPKLAEIKNWEEERRLFYVGMTRAKYKLYIYSFNDSSFVKELISQRKKKKKVSCTNNNKIKKVKQNESISFDRFKNLLCEGTRIKHKKFGEGIITDINNEKISVVFDGDFIKHSFNINAIYSLGVIEIL